MMSFLSNRQRLLLALLILSGLGLVALAFGIDAVGLGNEEGFGKQQQRMLGLGLVSLFAGIILSAPFSQRFVRWITTSDNPVPSLKNQLAELFRIAIWFGLLAGVVEGVGLLVLTRYLRKLPVWIEILWISPVLYVILLGIGAIFLAVLGRLLLRLPLRTTAVALAAFLLFVDWMVLALKPWPIQSYAFMILATGLTIAFMRWFRRNEARNFMFLRRSLPFLAATIILLLAVIEGGGFLREQIAIATLEEAPSDSPNVLFIVVDTLRADHLGTYGYERNTSPNIDRLADEGVVFESAFSTSSWTAPSHASMFTGTYMNEHNTQFSVSLSILGLVSKK